MNLSSLSLNNFSNIFEHCDNRDMGLSLPLFPFVTGEVMPATFSLPHLLVFSTLLCLVSSSYVVRKYTTVTCFE